MKPHVLFMGFGYTARHLAPLLRARGLPLIGTSRDKNKKEKEKERAKESTITLINFDGKTPLAPKFLRDAETIIVSIPPSSEFEDVVLHHHGIYLATSKILRNIIYLSSSSVYGDHDAAWVSEEDELKASHAVGLRRIKAEKAWQRWQEGTDKSLAIVRLAGIYGKGRSVLESVKRGKARRIIKKNQFFGRIHVEDAARIIDAVMHNETRQGCSIYNACDDEPAPPQDVILYASQLLGLAPPPAEDYATASLTEMMRSFYHGSKRLRNDKMKKELGVTLSYPNYRVGLTALMRDSNA